MLAAASSSGSLKNACCCSARPVARAAGSCGEPMNARGEPRTARHTGRSADGRGLATSEACAITGSARSGAKLEGLLYTCLHGYTPAKLHHVHTCVSSSSHKYPPISAHMRLSWPKNDARKSRPSPSKGGPDRLAPTLSPLHQAYSSALPPDVRCSLQLHDDVIW